MSGSGGIERKVAVVTGGGSGIGEAIARRLAADGARVAVLDIDEPSAARVAAEIDGLAVQVDVADPKAVDSAFDAVEQDWGPVDILINNAGISGIENVERVQPRAEEQLEQVAATGQPPTIQLDATVRLPDEEWERMITVNLSGVFYCTRRALQSMQPRRTGAIVNIASICGIAGCTGFPHYSAAKGGVLAFTRAVAKEVIGYGIRVNAIAPGYIDTPMAAPVTPALKTATALQTPIGRWGEPEEIAGIASFLASDDASFMVGETVSPNGGIITV